MRAIGAILPQAALPTDAAVAPVREQAILALPLEPARVAVAERVALWRGLELGGLAPRNADAHRRARSGAIWDNQSHRLVGENNIE